MKDLGLQKRNLEIQKMNKLGTSLQLLGIVLIFIVRIIGWNSLSVMLCLISVPIEMWGFIINITPKPEIQEVRKR